MSHRNWNMAGLSWETDLYVSSFWPTALVLATPWRSARDHQKILCKSFVLGQSATPMISHWWNDLEVRVRNFHWPSFVTHPLDVYMGWWKFAQFHTVDSLLMKWADVKTTNKIWFFVSIWRIGLTFWPSCWWRKQSICLVESDDDVGVSMSWSHSDTDKSRQSKTELWRVSTKEDIGYRSCLVGCKRRRFHFRLTWAPGQSQRKLFPVDWQASQNSNGPALWRIVFSFTADCSPSTGCVFWFHLANFTVSQTRKVARFEYDCRPMKERRSNIEFLIRPLKYGNSYVVPRCQMATVMTQLLLVCRTCSAGRSENKKCGWKNGTRKGPSGTGKISQDRKLRPTRKWTNNEIWDP